MLWYRHFAGNRQEHYPHTWFTFAKVTFLTRTHVFHSGSNLFYDPVPVPQPISEEAHKMPVLSSMLSNVAALQLSQLLSSL